MGGLAHYLEAAGIPTTQISLVREHTEKIKPPRALWVPFELGRPLGPPQDSAFQSRVLRAALELFERADGPVLEDYLEEMPEVAVEGEGWVCPVNFTAPAVELSGDAALVAAFRNEHSALATWFDRALEVNGRSSTGVARMDPDQVREMFCDLLTNGIAVLPSVGREAADLVRLAAEDLKAYYFEAAAAQPGKPGSKNLTQWFWRETSAARVLRTLQPRFEVETDPDLKLLGQLLLVPRVAFDLDAS